MALSPLSKNSIGVFFTLLLVILLSESKLFKIFTNTYLGRIILISIILFVSYLNKILATVCVFIIVIMFSIMIPKYEGFDDNKQNSEENVTINDNKNTQTNISDETNRTTKDKKIDVVTTMSAPDENSSITAIEGFDLQSTENTIRRGKQSNSIPVNQYDKQSIEVNPYEGSSFSNFFGLF